MLQPGVSLHEGKETRSSSRRTVRKGGLGLTHGNQSGNIRTTHADSESACVKADNKKAGKRYSNRGAFAYPRGSVGAGGGGTKSGESNLPVTAKSIEEKALWVPRERRRVESTSGSGKNVDESDTCAGSQLTEVLMRSFRSRKGGSGSFLMGGKEPHTIHRLNKGEGAGGSGCLETREESECGSWRGVQGIVLRVEYYGTKAGHAA
jgi:hypothetical protein